MADRLYLSIWFPSFREQEMLPRLLSVTKQFPFSAQRNGIGYMAVHSISWDQPIVFQQTFDYRAEPDRVLDDHVLDRLGLGGHRRFALFEQARPPIGGGVDGQERHAAALTAWIRSAG